jgi:hypothetical protein
MIATCLTYKHSRFSALMALFVIFAICGIVPPNISKHDNSKRLKWAASKTQGSTAQTSVAKHAPFAAVCQQTYEFKVPASHSATFRQESGTAVSIARSSCPTRAPPAAHLNTFTL